MICGAFVNQKNSEQIDLIKREVEKIPLAEMIKEMSKEQSIEMIKKPGLMNFDAHIVEKELDITAQLKEASVFFYFFVEEVLISSSFPSMGVQKSSMLGVFFFAESINEQRDICWTFSVFFLFCVLSRAVYGSNWCNKNINMTNFNLYITVSNRFGRFFSAKFSA